MTPEEARQLTIIYDDAIQKMKVLAAKKQSIIKQYIKELEDQKIKAIRENLGVSNQS